MIHRGVLEGALVLALTGCTTIPSPTEALAPGNSQVRLTEAAGAIEGGRPGFLNGGAAGTSCVLTVLGPLPAIAIDMRQGGCRVQVGDVVE